MAFRLAGWLIQALQSQTELFKDLGQAIQSYVQEGGFVGLGQAFSTTWRFY